MKPHFCGKTASGTPWVSREKTTVYDFYQMFMNSYDEDVERLLSFFSDYEIKDIKRMCKEDIRNAKKIMAFEVTKLVHVEEEALKIKKASEEIFSNKGNSDNMPQLKLSQEILDINIMDLLAKTELVSSKSEAKRLIQQNGISLNKQKVTDENRMVTNEDLDNKTLILQKGKKVYLKVMFD